MNRPPDLGVLRSSARGAMRLLTCFKVTVGRLIGRRWPAGAIGRIVTTVTMPGGCLFGRFLGFGHLLESFVDLADAFAGLGELGCLGEWLSDGFAGVGDLAAGAFDVGDSVLLAFLKAAEAVFQPGDQADGVGGVQILHRHLHGGAGCAVEDEGDFRLAE